MILGQLIQTGRRFCECRSHDFVPASEDTVVVIAYTIQDTFLAHSFDTVQSSVKDAVKAWLLQVEAVGYLLIRRTPRGEQRELPSPIGRVPMDHVTLTAATQYDFKVVSFFLEEISGLDSYRLVPTSCHEADAQEIRQNLFRLQETERQAEPVGSFFQLDESSN